MSDFKFEICANSVESCLAAQEGGADRVELCAGIPEGGTTPSYGEIKVARRLLTSTRLHIIIRPRGGDFLYSSLEIERMEEDIRMCRELGADGVVFGCLKADGSVDMEQNRRLMECAKGMSVTFHRAFDRTTDPFQAMEDIIDLGCNRILTSGQQPKAIEGTTLLAKLKEKADGRITLLAGSGVTEDNIRRNWNTRIPFLCPHKRKKQYEKHVFKHIYGCERRRRGKYPRDKQNSRRGYDKTIE